jgi:hypothetical protein
VPAAREECAGSKHIDARDGPRPVVNGSRDLSRSSRPTAWRSSATSSWRCGDLSAVAVMRSASPSAIALSLSCTAWLALVWLFCNSATIRNVTIVVSVLMSSLPGVDAADDQIGPRPDHHYRYAAGEEPGPGGEREARVANRSKKPTLPVTSDGMCGGFASIWVSCSRGVMSASSPRRAEKAHPSGRSNTAKRE